MNTKILGSRTAALALIGVLFVSGIAIGSFLTIYLFETIPINKPEEPTVLASLYINVNGKNLVTIHNVVCTVGKNKTLHYLFDETYVNNNASTNSFRWIAIGNPASQPVADASNTTLDTEFSRQIGTFAGVDGVTNNCTLTYTWTAGSFSGQTIYESGVFNEASNGYMIVYQSFSGITLSASDSLQVQWEFQIG